MTSEDLAILVQRGDSRVATGDIATARLFYERATKAGLAEAALELRKTHNAASLAQMGLSSVCRDAPLTAHWHQQPATVGVSEAKVPLANVGKQ